MRNKKRIYWVSVSLVCLVSFGLYSLWKNHVPHLDVDNYLQEVNARLEVKRDFIQSAEAAETPEIKAQRAVTVTRMQKIAAGEMDDIKFVGRVVDQDGNPVPGVEFGFDAIGNGMVPGPGRGTRHADEQGYIEINNVRASTLKIFGFKKPGYQYKTDNGYTRFSYFKNTHDANVWTDYTKKNPYIFTLWRIDGDTGAKELFVGSFTKLFADGRKYTLDFDLPAGHRKIDGVQNGDLIVRCKREGNKENRNKGNWEYTIEAIDGGLIETQDQYRNQAPEKGYVPSMTFKGHGDSAGENKMELNLYFSSRNGKHYGQIQAKFRPYYGDEDCILEWSVVMNPNGSRNLTLQTKE